MSLSYSENFDALIALTTHLGSTQLKSRRAPSLSRDLGFQLDMVRTVLNGFPEFFENRAVPMMPANPITLCI